MLALCMLLLPMLKILNNIQKEEQMSLDEINNQLEEIKQNDKLNEWTSKWALLGIVASVVLFGILLVIGEMTGNPLIPY